MRIYEYKDYPISIALNSLRDKGFELINIINANKYQLINQKENITLLIETYHPEDDTESVNRMYIINDVLTDFNLAMNEAYYYSQLKKYIPENSINIYPFYQTLYEFTL